MRRLGLGGVVAAACLVAAGATFAISATGGGSQATKQAGSEELKAFQRAPEAGDAIPRGAPGPLTRRFGRVVASRLIATADGFRGRAALYLLRLKRNYTCLIQVERRGAGGGCSPSGQFLSAKRRVAAGAGNGFLHGVAGNEIAKVAFVDRHEVASSSPGPRRRFPLRLPQPQRLHRRHQGSERLQPAWPPCFSRTLVSATAPLGTFPNTGREVSSPEAWDFLLQ
jgi:hypothetical protein